MKFYVSSLDFIYKHTFIYLIIIQMFKNMLVLKKK